MLLVIIVMFFSLFFKVCNQRSSPYRRLRLRRAEKYRCFSSSWSIMNCLIKFSWSSARAGLFSGVGRVLVWGAAGPAGAAGCCSGVWTVVETGRGACGLMEGTTAMTCRVLFFLKSEPGKVRRRRLMNRGEAKIQRGCI